VALEERKKAFQFEKYLKSGSGRAFINRHFLWSLWLDYGVLVQPSRSFGWQSRIQSRALDRRSPPDRTSFGRAL